MLRRSSWSSCSGEDSSDPTTSTMVPLILKTYSTSSNANLQSRSRSATTIRSTPPALERSKSFRRPLRCQLIPLAMSETTSKSGCFSLRKSICL
ncbi:hypothetical protein NY2A_b716R [Paramecium bursaria Chlorella virus NY2A]|uniref:Uncharacterized protein b084R n=1 Tax=Paramecium bursaria Chlorella virus NY2A TaxID=46021 RepID=A7IVV9_PBCVN|nr:hypothetical protein NY2A_b084R [Paramecium bursaria Chlorella virus NY2A]YP_001497578.1 hypothetical protein NY2A_b382R [Paramecium bursaria Chlorella virus NY2A]YP_001497912.1 hypothetical protein NY2A_b716R [Paramecium bursaria Chlorella virus NY2A]ABT14483.1 hypothetical protein NY2A_b084R [Paramecium bursaria Chlorella virus NY2A]ABT14781.1 hypothetical protein NY2A_b382R [Paramecium bursaria Chlorella virus NY2A]ABT15115.1 hypothetical protein NY2A_b716R [Paramecium bursaria Chlorella